MATTLTTSYQRISTINVTYGQIRTYAKYNSQSTASNTTTISLKTTYYLTQWISFSSGTSVLDGNSKSYGNTRLNAGETTLQEFTRTIYHNADGTSPNRNVATSWTAKYGGGGSTSADVVAPKILRQATLTSAPDFNDEANPTIKYTNPAGNSVNSLQGCITTASDGTIRVPYRDISKTGTSYTFNLTEAERNTLRSQTPNSNTLQVGFWVKTIIGGTTLWSSAIKTMTIVNGNPTFNDFEFEDTNTKTLELTGNSNYIVNGYSNVKLTVSSQNKAVANKGATMNKYRFIAGNSSVDKTYSLNEVSVILANVTGSTLSVIATDSRGNSTTVNKTASKEINYTAINFNKQSSHIERNDAQIGEEAILTLNGSFWNNTFGSVTNTLKSVSYRFKKTNEVSWKNGTTDITLDTNGNNFSFKGTIASNNTGGLWDLDASYNVEITVKDELTTATINLILKSAIPNIALTENGVGIMGPYNEQAGGPLQINGIPIEDYIYNKLVEGGKL